MKTLLTLTLILLSQLINGQTSYEFSTWLKTESFGPVYKFDYVQQTKQQKAVPWQITAVAVFAVTTEAIGDGLYDQGKQNGNQNQMMTGKALQAVSLASHFLYIPIMKNSDTHWLWIPAIEMGWRIVAFDPVYNATRGLPVGYIGNTDYSDKIKQKFNPPPGMQLFARGVVMTATISITFDKF